MTFSIQRFCFCASFLIGGTLVSSADDELFSKVDIESVFTTASSTHASVKSQESNLSLGSGQQPNVRDLDDLFDLVRQFDPQATRELGTVRRQQMIGDMKKTVRLTVQGDAGRVLIELELVVLSAKPVANERDLWIGLMQAANTDDSTFFAVRNDDENSRRRLVLRSSESSVGMTRDSLRDRLKAFGQFAVEHSGFWQPLSAAAKQPKKPAEEVSQPEQPKENEFSLIGNWVATPIKGEAYAIQFQDGDAGERPFQLVHVKDGKSTVSSGKYGFQSGSLSLKSGEGAPLTSPLSWKDANQFELQIGAAKVSFQRQP
ncbi:hypothetical protein [Rhodopirellula halodulae]|uniref:hypothetical protein n=1 Tax=Rhodopirellula halodulae TaxID=2894198 RepID=UPI001E460C3F|nr:hypothetical protein [Rhodopirellula sp. JC737]MCC9657349.1 hypothetical protein [Rhodopirellula sp. JC737]